MMHANYFRSSSGGAIELDPPASINRTGNCFLLTLRNGDQRMRCEQLSTERERALAKRADVYDQDLIKRWKYPELRITYLFITRGDSSIRIELDSIEEAEALVSQFERKFGPRVLTKDGYKFGYELAKNN